MSINSPFLDQETSTNLEIYLYNAQKRIKYIDIAKGLGIIFVVLGHNPYTLNPKDHLFYLIFLFHMPLFFFLSGLVYKSPTNNLQFIKNRSKGLLIPYFATLLFFMVALILKSQIRGADFPISDYIKSTIYSTGPELSWRILWFLTSLFITQIWFLFIERYLLKRIEFFFIRFSFMLILLLIGIHAMKALWLIKLPFLSSIVFFSKGIPGLPWSIDIVLITGFYFYLGTQYEIISHKLLKSNIIFILSLFLFFGLYFFFGNHLDLNFRIYDSPIINTLEAILGIILIIIISKFFTTKFIILGSILSYLGRISLIIFIFHGQFQQRTFRLFYTNSTVPLESICVLSFILGILGPILLYEIILKRIYLLKICYPIKRSINYS